MMKYAVSIRCLDRDAVSLGSHIVAICVRILLSASTFLVSVPAISSELVYAPTNPSFGGNAFNSAHLLGIANAQNKYEDPSAASSSDPAQQFLRTLQSRLLSSLATQVTDIIFGENAQNSGLIKFGDQEISFVRGLDSVTLTITNSADGSVTEIIIPFLQGNGSGPLGR